MHRNNRVFNLNYSKITPYIPFIVFTLIFAVGVLIGNLLVGKLVYFNKLATNIFSDFLLIRKSGELFNIIKDSLISIFSPYLILFLLGTSVIGSICTPIVIMLVGAKFGLISGYLYMLNSLNGIMFNALILIPSNLIMLFGLILLTNEAFMFSRVLSGVCVRLNKPVNIYSNFKGYCIKSAITLIAAFLSVVFDIGMSSLFINFFNF